MKKIYTTLFCLFSLLLIAQNDTVTKKKIKIYGGLESNAQWYTNDKERKIEHPEDPFRANSYLNLNVNYSRFTIGGQLESYEPTALLNYNPNFKKTDLGTYYANYKDKYLDFTVGHFYEQFGSGIILRTWEDRSLGINNALRGVKLNFKPIDAVSITALYGRQRTGFTLTDSDIYGINTDVTVSDFLKLENFKISTGFSYVVKDEKIESRTPPTYSNITTAYSTRLNLGYKNLYLNSEYNYKDHEPVLVRTFIDEKFIKPGNSLLLNLGYSKKGLGIDAVFRRMENMAFLSERQPTIYAPEISSLYFNDRILNYVPSLTKQHHSNLANIYVYQAQNRVAMQFDEQIEKFGEIGGQLDIFYNFKKGSALGGKYGTKISINSSNWFNLAADYSYINELGRYEPEYTTKFFKGNQKYFSDYNIEISKKITSNFKGNLMFSNQYYNDQYIRGIFQKNVIKSNILAVEGIYNFKDSKSLTIGAEHMWADNDRKNWASMSLEYNHNKNWSIFAMDMYNYGFDENIHTINEIDLFDIHFYNAGIAYKLGTGRLAVNYGRQRGGLVCAGGVCRFVPPSTGLGITLTKTF